MRRESTPQELRQPNFQHRDGAAARRALIEPEWLVRAWSPQEPGSPLNCPSLEERRLRAASAQGKLTESPKDSQRLRTVPAHWNPWGSNLA